MRRLHAWRRGRPFWAGALMILSGLALCFLPGDRYSVLVLPGSAGSIGFVLGGLQIVSGTSLWFRPEQRTFAGAAALLVGLASFVASNFGGLLVGMFLGLVGGALAVAWAPDRTEPPPTRHGRHHRAPEHVNRPGVRRGS